MHSYFSDWNFLFRTLTCLHRLQRIFLTRVKNMSVYLFSRTKHPNQADSKETRSFGTISNSSLRNLPRIKDTMHPYNQARKTGPKKLKFETQKTKLNLLLLCIFRVWRKCHNRLSIFLPTVRRKLSTFSTEKKTLYKCSTSVFLFFPIFQRWT